MRLSRRAALVGLAASGCRTVEPAVGSFRTFAAFLPNETALGQPFTPMSLAGQVALITFIATWCFPCLTELATLRRLERDLEARGFASVLVGMDLEGRLVLEPFAVGYRLTMPLLVGTDQLRAGFTPFGRIRELPTRFLFDRDGRLVVGYSGVARYEDLARLVEVRLRG